VPAFGLFFHFLSYEEVEYKLISNSNVEKPGIYSLRTYVKILKISKRDLGNRSWASILGIDLGNGPWEWPLGMDVGMDLGNGPWEWPLGMDLGMDLGDGFWG
jgi:hypothetical protein